MSAPADWVWSWANEKRKADGWLPRGLADRGGPDIDDARWAVARSAIYTLALEIYRLEIAFARGMANVSGAVTNDRAKRALSTILEAAGCSVRNAVEVLATFKSATGKGGPRPGPAAGQVEDVSRFPAISAAAAAVAGDLFVFKVDLGLKPDGPDPGPPVVLGDVPAGWDELPVTVEVACDLIAFEEGGEFGTVLLFADGSSRAARFSGRLLPGAAGTFGIRALFSHRGRHAGSFVQEFQVASPAQAAPAAPTRPARGKGRVKIAPGSEGATLVVKIISSGGGGRYLWSLEAPKDPAFGPGRRTGEVDLGDAKAFARRILRTCPGSKPGRHASVLRGMGEEVWKVAPPEFRRLYLAMRKELGARFPIQITTDEQHVPWEMMFPSEDAGLDEPDHLFMTHPVARWFLETESALEQTLASGRMATCVPAYADGSCLPAAIEEGKHLVSSFGAHEVEATHASWTGFWSSPPTWPVSVLHFAGHGSSALAAEAASPAGKPSNAGLRMLDGWVTPDEVHGGVTLGRRDGCFVVLNACSVAGADAELGVVDSFPARLAERGFRAVLAPAWAVQDEHASLVVREQLRLLSAGTDLGTAMLTARVAFRNASATPFAYVCFGDVMARMATAGVTPAPRQPAAR